MLLSGQIYFTIAANGPDITRRFQRYRLLTTSYKICWMRTTGCVFAIARCVGLPCL